MFTPSSCQLPFAVDGVKHYEITKVETRSKAFGSVRVLISLKLYLKYPVIYKISCHKFQSVAYVDLTAKNLRYTLVGPLATPSGDF